LHRQIGPLTSAVPVDEIACDLGIVGIRRAELDGCEGVLLTDHIRSQGSILVNTRRGPQAVRFSIAHELGHFLLERHVLGLAGTFTCTMGDLRETRTARQCKRQEVEANEFAIGLLVPEDRIAACLNLQPDIHAAAELRTSLDISLEAAMRCLIERHEEPVAAVWSKDGTIRYVIRGASFPWIARGRNQRVSALSRTAEALAAGGTGATPMREVGPAAWTNEDIPELFEQVRVGKDGHALTLLWATLPQGSEQDDADD
jgi:hypothetical protein